MATRFYLSAVANAITPGIDTNWEQTNRTVRQLVKKTNTIIDITGSTSTAIPITTTQDIISLQYYSEPLKSQRISGTVSLVIKCSEDVATANATLAVSVRVVSNDGGTSRGTLFSVFGTDTELPVTASAATRIVNAQTLTPLTALGGDRLSIEIGARVTAPTTAGNLAFNYGTTGVTDFALTSGLTTNLNPWVEFSHDFFGPVNNNYQSIKVGNGMSTGEKIR